MDTNELNHFCRRWLDAWTGNRPQNLIEFYSADAFYRDPARPNGLRGRVQLLEYFTKLLARNPNWRWSASEIIPTANGFVLKWSATMPKSSSAVSIEGIDILELRDGKICRNEVYFDRTALVEGVS